MRPSSSAQPTGPSMRPAGHAAATRRMGGRDASTQVVAHALLPWVVPVVVSTRLATSRESMPTSLRGGGAGPHAVLRARAAARSSDPPSSHAVDATRAAEAGGAERAARRRAARRRRRRRARAAAAAAARRRAARRRTGAARWVVALQAYGVDSPTSQFPCAVPWRDARLPAERLVAAGVAWRAGGAGACMPYVQRGCRCAQDGIGGAHLAFMRCPLLA